MLPFDLELRTPTAPRAARAPGRTMTSILDDPAVPVHVRVGDRGSPRQDVRPEISDAIAGRHHRRGPEQPESHAKPPRRPPGTGARRDHPLDVRGFPGRRPRHGQGDRLHQRRVGLRLPDLRNARVRARSSRPTSPRVWDDALETRPRQDGTGCRGPGNDGRLRLPRNAGTHAAPDALATAWPAVWPKSARAASLPYLRPDGKTQVTVEYDHGVPKRVVNVVRRSAHNPDVDIAEAPRGHHRVGDHAIIPAELRVKDPVMHVNATGRFVIAARWETPA